MDRAGNDVIKLSAKGTLAARWGGLLSPLGIASGGGGVYVADTGCRTIAVWK